MHEALDVGDRDRAPTLWEQPILDSKECRTDTKNKKKSWRTFEDLTVMAMAISYNWLFQWDNKQSITLENL
jgi:hypothetical protein